MKTNHRIEGTECVVASSVERRLTGASSRIRTYGLGSIMLLGIGTLGCGPVDFDSSDGLDFPTATTSEALTATEVEPLTPSANWTLGTAAGSVGTFFADVTGGSTNATDLILVNNSTIQVRRSPGASPFNSATTWSSTGFVGSVATRFADVTGDNRADAIQVNSSNIRVRRSTGTSFSTTVETWAGSAFTGSGGTHFFDVTGDKRADAIAVDSSSGIRVRRSTGSAFSSTIETWLSGPYTGAANTYFADVTGDGRVDAITNTGAQLVVRRAPASGPGPFGPAETWAEHGAYGQRSNHFVDVTGDGLADYVAVNANNIEMRRSGGWYFGPVETLSTAPTTGTLAARGFADFTGDGRADYIEVPSSGAVKVRTRQDRKIPIRFVQLAPNCIETARLVSDTQLQFIIDSVNQVYRDVGLTFFAATPIGTQDCTGYTKSQVSVSPAFSDNLATETNALPLTEVAKAVRFNPSCQLGEDAIMNLPPKVQISWAAPRCGNTNEIIVYVATANGFSQGSATGANKFIWFAPGDANVNSNASPILAHELGHYFGLPHVMNDELQFPLPGNYIDPLTGQFMRLSMLWDLVLSTAANPPLTFKSRSQAEAQELSLAAIEDFNVKGWFCPSNDPTKPCPPLPNRPGTLGEPAGGAGGPIWYSGDARLSGLSRPNPNFSLANPADGGFATNIMSYGYPGDPQSSFPPKKFSLSQIETIQNNLNNDVIIPIVAVSGAPLYGHRPLLGITGTPQQISFVPTVGAAKPGPGTLSTNGAETWTIGTNAYDGDGNMAWRYNTRTFGWDGFPMGAQQIAVPSDGTRTGGGVSPWAIVTSGRVKRYDGSTFATLPNDPGFCATSLAVGPLGGQRKYAWALGCTPVSGGNYELHRYRHVDGSGGWVRSPAFAGVQVTVDGTGAPWIRTAAGLTFRVTLDANDVPIGVNSFNPPGGTALQIAAGGHGNLFLPPVVLTPNGHLHIWNFDNTESWYDAGATPVTFNVITGSIPYLWAVASDGRIWYQR